MCILWVTATSDVILYPNFVGASVITDVPRGHDPGQKLHSFHRSLPSLPRTCFLKEQCLYCAPHLRRRWDLALAFSPLLTRRHGRNVRALDKQTSINLT